MKNKKRKIKAISPVVSTVLLVMIVIIIAAIIYLWAQGLIKEVITKTVGGETKNIEQFCPEISLTAIVNPDQSFGFHNIGNVPIWAFNLKLVSKNKGSSEVRKISGKDGLVNSGFSTIIKDVEPYDHYDEITVIPILLGKSTSGNQEYTCPEQYGVKI